MKTTNLNSALLIKPSAFIPLFMAFLALSMVLIHFAIYGIVYEPDEGTMAHLFQLLMVGQLPFVAYFIIKWIQIKPKQTLQILVLQITLWILAIAAVIFLT